MLFDYLFLTAIGLDWLILGLVVFGGKALSSPLSESGKNFFRNSLFTIVLLFLLFIFIIKIFLVIVVGLPLKNFIASDMVSTSFFLFVFFQLLFAFVFLIFGMLLFVKNGFKDDFQPVWSKHIFSALVFSLLVDFFTGLALYFRLLEQVFPAGLKHGHLSLAYQPFSTTHYWLALGLILSLIVYFIFYLAVKYRNSANTVTGMTLSYWIVLMFAGLLVYYYHSLIAPDARFLMNNFALYLAMVIWATVLGLGIGSLFLMILFFRKRKLLKNDFYFRYILMRLGGFHAVAVVGFSIITLIPIVFFTLYR